VVRSAAITGVCVLFPWQAARRKKENMHREKNKFFILLITLIAF
jgi:hypothetical protein